MHSNVLLWLGFVGAVGLCIYQRMTIFRLTDQLAGVSHRSKRAIDFPTHVEKPMDNSVYFPVYAQISRKAMRKLCEEHRLRPSHRDHREHRRIVAKPPRNIDRKKCSLGGGFSPPRQLASRQQWSGCALRDGSKWYVCEFHLGYTILEYADTAGLTSSQPSSLETLPYPYQGTDLVAYNGSIIYASDDSLVLYNLTSLHTHKFMLNFSKDPIYVNSFSRVDLEADEHGVWAIYRTAGETRATVSRISIPGLKPISTWNLQLSNKLCNTFIRCGILYGITCNPSGIVIQPIYDFYSGMEIVGKTTTIKDVNGVSSASYDPSSHSVSIFALGGSIYSLDVDDTVLS